MKDWVCDRFSKGEPDQSDLSYLSPINKTAGAVMLQVDLEVLQFLVRDVLRGG